MSEGCRKVSRTTWVEEAVAEGNLEDFRSTKEGPDIGSRWKIPVLGKG